MEKQKIFEEKKIYIVCSIHFIISSICSHSFFFPIKENAGSENIAYTWFETGTLLQNDNFSRIICRIYAYAFAIIFILVFWKWIFSIIDLWKSNIIEKKYILVLLTLVASGILTILALYPITVTTPPDTTYNYVYAKEWLPMYWHGFLTNVIHCACLLVFPHPVSMSIVPFMFGINIIFYFTYNTIVKYSNKYAIIKILIWGCILLIMPETIRLLTYAGRNYMYAILSAGVMGIFFKDYLDKTEFSKKKFRILSFLVVCLSVWRSEGILYLAAYPFLLYFTYFFQRRQMVEKRELLKGIIYVVAVYLILSLPGSYGNKKYQGFDYFIINTPGPLSAVFSNESADLSYDGADEDLSNIEKIVPLEYIQKYGELATCNYNWDNFRLSRQSNAGESGKDYVIASYSILLHNWPIYFKYQINLFAKSIGLPVIFQLPAISIENWGSVRSSEVGEWVNWVMDYYSVGGRNIAVNYDIVLLTKKIDIILNNSISFITSKIYELGWEKSGFIKIFVTLLTIAVSIVSLLKKEWIYVFWGVLIITILAIVILMAPAARENYYYSAYFNQYWFLYFAWFQRKQGKNCVESA